MSPCQPTVLQISLYSHLSVLLPPAFSTNVLHHAGQFGVGTRVHLGVLGLLGKLLDGQGSQKGEENWKILVELFAENCQSYIDDLQSLQQPISYYFGQCGKRQFKPRFLCALTSRLYWEQNLFVSVERKKSFWPSFFDLNQTIIWTSADESQE